MSTRPTQCHSSKHHRRKWLVLAAGTAIVALLAVFALRNYIWHPTVTIDRERYPVAGIDVSNHNGVIDFQRVAAAGIEFAIVKASEGTSYVDPRFTTNVDGAHQQGLKVGAYHFYRKNSDGMAQAQHFMQQVAGVTLDLPLVIDVEDWGNDLFADEDNVAQQLRQMVTALSDSGHRVMIYTNGDGYTRYYKNHFTDIPLWLCSFKAPENLERQQRGHSIQQYSHWGRIDGIDGDVDLNIFMGDRARWQQFLSDSTRLSSTPTTTARQ